MSSFEFADCPTSVPLAPIARAGKTIQAGTLLLTLRNRTGRALSGRISVRPDAGSKPAWFAIDGAVPTSPGERDVDLEPNATVSVKLAIAVPPDGAAGNHLFKVRVAAETDPDNDFVDSPSVAFVVTPAAPAADPPKQKFPWWAVAIGLAVVIVVGGGAMWWAMRDRGAPDVRNPTPTSVVGEKLQQAQPELTAQGYVVSYVFGGQPQQQAFAVTKQEFDSATNKVTLTLDPGPRLMDNTDLPGQDRYHTPSKSALECEGKCNGDAACRAWTYLDQLKACFLKDTPSNIISRADSTSGIKR